MKQITLIITFCILTIFAFADTTNFNINRRLNDVEHTIKLIDANQLNYKIEKDLLKETYSNNYEKISLVITLLIGIIGVLGYLGLKDITTIKKEYEKELSNLRQIQGQFNLKSQKFDIDKQKFDEELKSIIKDNEVQNKKIKFIELKDKVRTLLKDNNLALALEFANAALSLSEKDTDVLNQKGRILCRLNQMKDAVDAFTIARNANPNDNSTILNATECLYFARDLEGAKKLIDEHKALFESKDIGRLLELFNIIELYFGNKKDELLSIVKGYVDFQNLNTTGKKMLGWDLTEAHYFIHYQADSELKTIIQNIMWYWDEKITGKTLLTRLNIELPIKEEEKE
jgi:tetratricopeptide (TPR) repeat protein